MTALCFGMSSCGKTESDADIWAEAMYTEDTVVGEGEKTVMIEVVADNKSVTLTVNTDEEILGDALTEYNLIEGEEGAYGLYVKKVNGITADYDINKTYWGLNKNGEGLTTGVDGVEFEDGEHYEFVYNK